MITPLKFMQDYRKLMVPVGIDDPITQTCRTVSYPVQLKKYFMMNWTGGTEQQADYSVVTAGSTHDRWFRDNRERICTAAMGKGAPRDYELALEWAVRSKKIPTATSQTLQNFCDEHLGIDCSGFVTNYLVACGKKTYSSTVVRNTGAASYFKPSSAVNDAAQIKQGDLLVWMSGNVVKTNPGHIAIVESYVAQSRPGGNMRVVEATGAGGANPKILDSMYMVEKIVPKANAVPMILVVKRHGYSGDRVAVIRV